MINEKTLKKLEFSTVLHQLSAFCRSTLAKTAAEDILPAATFDDAKFLIDELTQAYNLYAYESSFDFSVDDITDAAQQARVHSALSMGQLLMVMRTLRTARSLQRTLLAEYPVDTEILKAHAYALFSDKTMEEDIDFAILSDEEMNDKASAELYALRRKIKQINADIKQKLASYSKTGELSKYLQDTIVTERNGRYVIPVKQEYRSYVHGIVHDQSGSGSTIFVEPMAIVELNNQLRTTISEEREEIMRILQSFTDRIAPYAERLLSSNNTIVHLDVLFSKVRYAIETRASRPELNGSGYINLKNARHPLLDRKKVVPTNLTLGRDFDILVITGPNTGGKTVALKTTGLMCLMAMSGLYIPATEGSAVSFFSEINCDIGDEQSIEQSLSTFSSHITNIRNILSKCDHETLVLIDEVGAGTEPNEGTALALAITEYLRNSGAKCVITTHYGQLKEYSLTTERVENASMEFNPDTFEPTYRLIVGVPGSSNAIAIASKLGLQAEVIKFAQQNVSAESSNFEKVLHNAEILRQQYEEQQNAVLREKQELQRELQRTKQLNDSLSKERDKLLTGARIEAKRVVEAAEQETKELIEEIKGILNSPELQDKSLFEARALAKQLKNIKYVHSDNDDADEIIFTGDKIDFSTLKIGDVVYSDKLGVQVKVTGIKSREKITVQAGALSAVVSADELYFSKSEVNAKAKNKSSADSKTKIDNRSYRNEINVLGQTVSEAITNVDNFIDNSVLAGLNTIWVIHGMGTGRLRAGLHQHFKTHKSIAEFRLGKYGEGETGVTVITLK
jgi:DNA mismatch repair protein MutS2